MKTRLHFLGPVAALLILAATDCRADALACGGAAKKTESGSTLATASFFSNMRNKEGSLRYEVKRLLEEAQSKLASLKPPQDACPPGCSVSETPDIVFESAPNKLLAEYDDKAHCAALLAETEKSPLRYQGSSKSLDEFASQYSDFSQGSGEQGKDLYKKCDESCSPRYLVVLKREGEGFKSETTVICGHARDKDDDQYKVSVSFVWKCR